MISQGLSQLHYEAVEFCSICYQNTSAQVFDGVAQLTDPIHSLPPQPCVRYLTLLAPSRGKTL